MNDTPPLPLADIELPFVPTWADWLPYIALPAAVVLIAILLITIGRRATRRRTNSVLLPADELAQLQRAYAAHTYDARELAYRLADTLKRGLHVSHLHDTCPDDITTERDTWPRIVGALRAARYERSGRLELDAQDFAVMATWLRRQHTPPREHAHV